MSGGPNMGKVLSERDPAFPQSLNGWHAFGVTRRDYFAAAALRGVLANPDHSSLDPREVAAEAVEHADALIEALKAEFKP